MFYKRGKVICDPFEHLDIWIFGMERPQKQKKRDYVGNIYANYNTCAQTWLSQNLFQRYNHNRPNLFLRNFLNSKNLP